MKRFQMDRLILVRRWRIECEKHGKDFTDCHCSRGMCTMRTHRPYERSPTTNRSYCHLRRLIARRDRRQEHYTGRRDCLALE